MKIIYRSIADSIREAKFKAEAEGRSLKYIELTPDEMDELKEHCGVRVSGWVFTGATTYEVFGVKIREVQP